MKKNMKNVLKRLAILPGIILLCFFVSGCNSVHTNKDLKMEKPAETTLTFLVPDFWGVGEKQDFKKVLQEIESSPRNVLNIHLVYNLQRGEAYAQSVLSVLAAGQNLDAIYCVRGNYDVWFNLTKLSDDNMIKDLTGLLPKYAPDLNMMFSGGRQLDSVKVNGRIMGIPNNYPLVAAMYAIVREDFMRKYHITEISSYDDYTQYLKIVKENEKSILPGMIMGTTEELFANAFGYDVLDTGCHLVYKTGDASMKVMPWEQTPAFIKGVNYLRDWYGKKYLEANQNSLSWNNDTEMKLAGGEVSSCICLVQARTGETVETVISRLNSMIGSNGNPNAKFRAYQLYPEKKVVRTNTAVDFYTGGCIAVNANSKNAERLLMFLNWVQSSQKNYDLLMYGIEKKHYSLKNNQLILPIGAGYDNNPYIGWVGNWMFRNIEYDRIPYDSSVSSNYMNERKNFLESKTRYLAHEGFIPDYKAVKSIVDARQKYFHDNIIWPLIDGNYKWKDTQKKIKELDDLGTNMIIRTVQEQLDDWHN